MKGKKLMLEEEEEERKTSVWFQAENLKPLQLVVECQASTSVQLGSPNSIHFDF